MAELAKTAEQILASVRFVDKLSIVSFCGVRRLELCVLVAFTREIPDATTSLKHKSAANRIVLGVEGGHQLEKRRKQREKGGGKKERERERTQDMLRADSLISF